MCAAGSLMDFLEAGAVLGQGHIAQQIFWYSAFTHALSVPTLPVMNADGTPKWRMAPSPHGAYWKEGRKLGYQDVGLWTLLKYAPLEKTKCGWLYAQFVTSKTVTQKKSLLSLHLIRESDIWSEAMTELRPRPAAWSSSIVVRPACSGLLRASMFRTTVGWLRSGGRTSRKRFPERRRRNRRWTGWLAIRTRTWLVCNNRGCKASSVLF
jgi:hypothetical protein